LSAGGLGVERVQSMLCEPLRPARDVKSGDRLEGDFSRDEERDRASWSSKFGYGGGAPTGEECLLGTSELVRPAPSVTSLTNGSEIAYDVG
jgi:hypothetical protein